MSKLASIEIISNIQAIPNADKIVLANVLGYQAVIKKDDFQIGEKVLFVQPDTILPNTEWAAFYKSKSSRVKAVKLRGTWSMGIIEKLSNVGLEDTLEIGAEVSERLNIIKYEPPIPQDLNAKGPLRFGISKTDEERWENLDCIPYDEEVIITLKIDGSSASYFCKHTYQENVWDIGLTSRSLELKPECVNNYTRINEKYGILNKLLEYCIKNKKSYCLRGEIYGQGVQKMELNPHSKLTLDFAAFGLLNLDTLQYENFHLLEDLCQQLDIPHVPVLEETILTPELIKKYSEDLEKLNGNYFEGVVIKRSNGQSFKVINKHYDSKK